MCTDKQDWINETSHWKRYQRLYASLLILYLIPNPLLVDYLFTNNFDLTNKDTYTTRKNLKRIRNKLKKKSQHDIACVRYLTAALNVA